MGRKRNKNLAHKPTALKQIIAARFSSLQNRLESKISKLLSAPAPSSLAHIEIFSDYEQGGSISSTSLAEVDGVVSVGLKSGLELLMREVESHLSSHHLVLLNCIEQVYDSLNHECCELHALLCQGFQEYVSVAHTSKVVLESLFQSIVVNNQSVKQLVEKAGIKQDLPVSKEKIENSDTSDEGEPKPQRKRTSRLKTKPRESDDPEVVKLVQSLEKQEEVKEKLKPKITSEWIQNLRNQLSKRIESPP